MTILYIAGTPNEAMVTQLTAAGYSLTTDPAMADGIVTLPTMPAHTVRWWLTEASNRDHMTRLLGKEANK